MKIFNDLQSLNMKDLRSSKNFKKYINNINSIESHDHK